MIYRNIALTTTLCMFMTLSHGQQIDNILLQALEGGLEFENESLRGSFLQKFGSKFDMGTLKDMAHCSISAMDAEKCSQTESGLGKSKCNWCNVATYPKLAACVDPMVIKILKLKGKGSLLQCGDAASDMNSPSVFTDVFVEQDAFDFDEYKCSAEALFNPEKCHQTKDSHGEPCTSCAYTGLSPKKMNVCVSKDQASHLHQLPGATCQVTNEEMELASEENVEFNLPDLSCTLDAFGDEAKCKASTTKDNSPCQYCTMSAAGKSSGMCLSSIQADFMRNKIGKSSKVQVDCGENVARPSSMPDSLEGIEDFSKLKCTLNGLMDENKCYQQAGCSFCEIEEGAKSMGLCIHESFVQEVESRSDKVHCGVKNEIESNVLLEVNPTYACNVNGVDDVTCLDKSKVQTDCTWCDAEIGGFCFPASWKDNAGKFLKCTTSKADLPPRENDVEMETH